MQMFALAEQHIRHSPTSWLILLNSIVYDCVYVITIQTLQLHHTCHTICYHVYTTGSLYIHPSVNTAIYELEFVSARLAVRLTAEVSGQL